MNSEQVKKAYGNFQKYYRLIIPLSAGIFRPGKLKIHLFLKKQVGMYVHVY